MTKVKISDLQIGDVIKFTFDGYSAATVYEISDSMIKVIRPYIHVSDVVYHSDNRDLVITYIGQEEVSFYKDSNTEVILLEATKRK